MRYRMLFCLLVVLLEGCATLEHPQLAATPKPSPDESLVYFYRESRFTGSALTFTIHDGEQRIGAVGSGTYFFYLTEPGQHIFSSKTEAEDSVEIDLKPDTTYYVKTEVRWGFFAGRPKFTIVNELEGDSRIKGLKYAQLKNKDKAVHVAGHSATKESGEPRKASEASQSPPLSEPATVAESPNQINEAPKEPTNALEDLRQPVTTGSPTTATPDAGTGVGSVYGYVQWQYSEKSKGDFPIEVIWETPQNSDVLRRGEKNIKKLPTGTYTLTIAHPRTAGRTKPNWEPYSLQFELEKFAYLNIVLESDPRGKDGIVAVSVYNDDKLLQKRFIVSK